jgi:hypothetical protein
MGKLSVSSRHVDESQHISHSHTYGKYLPSGLSEKITDDDVDLSRSPLEWESIPENPFSSLLSFLVRIHRIE